MIHIFAKNIIKIHFILFLFQNSNAWRQTWPIGWSCPCGLYMSRLKNRRINCVCTVKVLCVIQKHHQKPLQHMGTAPVSFLLSLCTKTWISFMECVPRRLCVTEHIPDGSCILPIFNRYKMWHYFGWSMCKLIHNPFDVYIRHL